MVTIDCPLPKFLLIFYILFTGSRSKSKIVSFYFCPSCDGSGLLPKRMIGDFYQERTYSKIDCPICGIPFSKCGLANHVRRHGKLARKKAAAKRPAQKSAAWWEGWIEGYRTGVSEIVATASPVLTSPS